MVEKHGESDTPLYRLWVRTIYKCTKPGNIQYKHYGARGISIHPDWKSFSNFRDWALANHYIEGKKLVLKEGSAEFGPDTAELRYAKRSNYAWNALQDKFLTENYEKMTRTEIASRIGHTPEAVSARVTTLKLNKRGKAGRHGGSTTKLYKLWASIKSRSNKGIVMDEAWKKDWTVFRDWANNNGYDGKLLLNRKDLDGAYSPDNCVFADGSMRQRRKKWEPSAQKYLIDNYASQTAKMIGESIGKSESQVLAMACLLRKRGLLTERKRSAKAELVTSPDVIQSTGMNTEPDFSLTESYEAGTIQSQPDNNLSDTDHLLGQSQGLYQSEGDILDELQAEGRSEAVGPAV